MENNKSPHERDGVRYGLYLSLGVVLCTVLLFAIAIALHWSWIT